MQARKKEIAKDGGNKIRVLSIPAIRDRVVQGALKLILEPIFEADFQSGSYGYRPKRTAHQAVNRVAQAIVEEKTRVIDVDLRSYFDNVQHALLLKKVGWRVQDAAVMHLLKTILKAIREVLDEIPPELSADIFDRGIALCGGGALLRNLDRRIHEETHLPVQIVQDPLTAVVIGAGKMLADEALLKKLAVH